MRSDVTVPGASSYCVNGVHTDIVVHCRSDVGVGATAANWNAGLHSVSGEHSLAVVAVTTADSN